MVYSLSMVSIKSHCSSNSSHSHSSREFFIRVLSSNKNGGCVHGFQRIRSHIGGVNDIGVHSFGNLVQSVGFDGTGVNGEFNSVFSSQGLGSFAKLAHVSGNIVINGKSNGGSGIEYFIFRSVNCGNHGSSVMISPDFLSGFSFQSDLVEVNFLFRNIIQFRVNKVGGIRGNIGEGFTSNHELLDTFLSVKNKGVGAFSFGAVRHTGSQRLTPSTLSNSCA